MKKIALVCIAIGLAVVSCMDIEEKISINSDNSGTYSYNINMSRMMEMMSQMGQSDMKEKLPGKKDTLINLKNFADTSTQLTTEEKAALRDGTIKIHADEENNEMKLTLDFPFKNMEQLNFLKKNGLTALGKMKALDKALNGESANTKPGADDNLTGGSMGMSDGSMPGSDFMNNAFSFNAGKNILTNKLTDRNAIAGASSDSAAMAMQMMSMMMGDFTFTTIVTLPKAVKNYSGNKAVVSADKKTITFNNTLANLMQKPESGEFSIEY